LSNDASRLNDRVRMDDNDTVRECKSMGIGMDRSVKMIDKE